MQPDIAEKIEFLSRFRSDINAHFNGGHDDEDLRRRINRGMQRARDLVSETGSLRAVTLSPPPAIGGLIVNNADPFNFILQNYYGMSLIPKVSDMIDQAIGVMESPEYEIFLAERASARSATDDENQSVGKGKPTANSLTEPELPSKVTLSWLVRHVPISFWFWLVGLLVAAAAFGAKIGPLMQR